MTQVREVEKNVLEIQDGNRLLVLVGTAHVSLASAELVEKVIRKYQPDSVCVELCDSRYEALREPDRWRKTDIFQVIRAGKAYLLMAQLALASFQKRLAKQLGIRPGEEMLRALQVADELSIPVVRIDRDVRVTLKRAWRETGLWGFAQVLAGLLSSMFSKEEMTAAEIEQLKEGDALSSLMAEFSGSFPGIKRALIDERDQYMLAKLRNCPGKTLVAVVGAGHVPGMQSQVDSTIDLASLEEMPPKGLFGRSGGWLFPLILLAFLAYAAMASGVERSAEIFATWALVNGAGAAVAAVICGAHILTVLVAFISAPFAAIHPLIAVGWVCALVEAFLRKPMVSDFETLPDDIGSVRGVWRNGVSRIFLILLGTNLGSLAGTIVGLWVATR